MHNYVLGTKIAGANGLCSGNSPNGIIGFETDPVIKCLHITGKGFSWFYL